MSSCEVLFIDRVSPGSLSLARRASELGAIIYFEPSNHSEDKNYEALLQLATIVKYSHDRIDELGLHGSSSVLMEIQTLGRGGIRFRSKLGGLGRGWHHLQAEPVKNLVDTAGSGDWFSAGLIAALCSKGMLSLREARAEEILNAIAIGQALAAWNCGFVGARGGMYTSALSEIKAIYKAYRSPRSGKSIEISVDSDKSTLAQICGDCQIETMKAKAQPSRRQRA
jgi:fructokinase